MSRYEWDSKKAAATFRRHGITFEEAESVAIGSLSLEEVDVRHSGVEERLKIIGWSALGRVLVVVVSESHQPPRIISARRATKRERDAYTE